MRAAKSRAVKVKTTVVLPDIHGHLVDEKAFGVALGYITENPVHRIIVSGDGADFECLSKYRRSLRVRAQLQEEQRCGRSIRSAIDKAAPNAEKEWQEGNHERRLRDFLVDKADELSEWLDDDDQPAITVDSFLSLRRHGWRYIPTTAGKSTYTYVGEICVGHFDKALKTPGAAALQLMNDRGESVLQSHTHKTGGGVKRFPNGREIMGYEIGCLCSLDPSYTTDPTWSHGFAIIQQTVGSNRFYFQQVNIVGHEALIDGVRYTP